MASPRDVRGFAVRGGAAVIPRRFLASAYWRAVTETFRFRASDRTRLNVSSGALRSHPSTRLMVSADDIDEAGRGSAMMGRPAGCSSAVNDDGCTWLIL